MLDALGERERFALVDVVMSEERDLRVDWNFEKKDRKRDALPGFVGSFVSDPPRQVARAHRVGDRRVNRSQRQFIGHSENFRLERCSFIPSRRAAVYSGADGATRDRAELFAGIAESFRRSWQALRPQRTAEGSHTERDGR